MHVLGAQRLQRGAGAAEKTAGDRGRGTVFRRIDGLYRLFLSRNGFRADRSAEYVVAEQRVPIRKIDHHQAAGQQRPAENGGADRADQIAQDSFRNAQILDGGSGQHLADGAAGERQLGHAGASDAELVGQVHEGIRREGEEQHHAQQQQRFAHQEHPRPSPAGQQGPHRPQQGQHQQYVSGQPEKIEQPVAEVRAEVADPVGRWSIHAAGYRCRVRRRIGDDRQKRQQHQRKIKNIPYPEAGVRFLPDDRLIRHRSPLPV